MIETQDAALAAFQAEVRAFLEAELTPELREGAARTTSVFVDPSISLPWQTILHRRGWAAPEWPAQFGGPGWDDMQRYVFAAECARAGAPSLSPMGLKMVAPVIMHYGTPDQQAHYLPRILSGEDYWCQGFSEPGSGSDLASLQLRAVRDGQDYVLNGSKIWTTHAHFANRMFCLVRTSTEGKPQAGISFLLLDMASPGITVKPIRTLAGDHEFNQVFFDDVRVPQRNLIGEEGKGFTYQMKQFQEERLSAAARRITVLDMCINETIEYTRNRVAFGRPILDNQVVHYRLAELKTEVELLRSLVYRAADTYIEGNDMTQLASMAKLKVGRLCREITDSCLQYWGGMGFTLDNPVSRAFRDLRLISIGGGADEVMLQIICKNMGTLPKRPV